MPVRLHAVLVGAIFAACSSSATADTPPQPNFDYKGEAAVITVRKDGVILWNKTPITCKQLNARILSGIPKEKWVQYKIPCGTKANQDTP
jgi:hypothetical protein